MNATPRSGTSRVTAPIDARLRSWRWRVFAATWLCYAGYYFCRKPFSIAKGQLADDLHLDASTLGTIGAAYLIAYALGQFLAGALGNRYGGRVMLLSGMAVSIAMNVGFGMASTASAFILLMTVNGIAQATGWSANIGTMASWFHRHERGKVMGWWATNFQVGGVAANALASLMLGHFDYHAAFFSGAAVLLAVFLVVLTNQRNRPEDVGLPPVLDPVGPNDLVAPAHHGLGWDRKVVTNLALVSVVYFFLKFIRYALWSWAPFFLARNFSLEPGDAGYLSTTFDLLGIPGVIVTGWLSDKFFGSRRAGVCLMMLILLTASCGLLYFAGQVSVPVFAVGIGLIGFTLYGPDALLTGAGVMDIGSRRGATLAAGIISGVGSAGAVLQDLVIGKLYDADQGDLGRIFQLLLASAVLATLVMTVVVVRNRLGKSDV